MRFILLVLLLLSNFGYTEMLPILAQIEDPMAFGGGTGDPTFARKLEKVGDSSGAILEWQRIAHSADDEEQANALLKVGRLAIKYGRNGQANAALTKFMHKFPKNENLPEALYLRSLTVPAPDRPATLQLLQRVAPKSEWTTEAVYHAVWDEARLHSLPAQTYTDPRAQQLTRRLADLSGHFPNQFIMTILAFLPGSALMWYGETARGFMFLGAFALLLWVLFFAIQQRHIPYAVWWAVVLLGIGVSAYNESQILAANVQLKTRISAIDSWEGLKPKLLQELK